MLLRSRFLTSFRSFFSRFRFSLSSFSAAFFIKLNIFFTQLKNVPSRTRERDNIRYLVSRLLERDARDAALSGAIANNLDFSHLVAYMCVCIYYCINLLIAAPCPRVGTIGERERVRLASDRRAPIYWPCVARRAARIVSSPPPRSAGSLTTTTTTSLRRRAAVCHDSCWGKPRRASVVTPEAPARPEAHRCTFLSTGDGAAFIELSSRSSPEIHSKTSISRRSSANDALLIRGIIRSITIEIRICAARRGARFCAAFGINKPVEFIDTLPGSSLSTRPAQLAPVSTGGRPDALRARA